jgi:hypothetical protein
VDGGWRGGETGGGEKRREAVVAASQQRSERRLVCEADDQGPHGFVFFSNLFKTSSTWKLKKEGLSLL